ncbi:CHASE domain-containing protein [Caldimonas tepidiphila]|uniref:CHASE domain-containing protein n=1 Tax=Caldimonas tepidiphila TaxID=2315841 RepID=UPI001472F75B|nr:CHASE domain-containing protein [Caldimonas tepidiphila]
MNVASERPRTSSPSPVSALWPAPLLVFLLSLLVTGALLALAWRALEARDQARFGMEATRTVTAIQERIRITSALLEGAAGLFAASEQVNKDEFAAYVERLDLRERYPGILGIGFSRRIPAGELEQVQQQMRAQHGPSFRVWPTEPRDEYHSILFLEPLDQRNAAAIGYDMYSEAERRSAMAAARDSGQARASGKVMLVQEIDKEKQAGFLIYRPIYRGLEVPAGPDQRRERLLGFVYSPLRVGDLLQGVRGGSDQLDFELYDGTEARPEALLRTTNPDASQAPHIQVERTLEVAGRPWLVRLKSRPEFDSLSQQQMLPWLALACLAASALLAFITLLQARAREAAQAVTRAQAEAAERLHREHSWLAATLGSIGDAVVAVDARQRILFMNGIAARLTGWSADEARGRPLTEVVRTRDAAAGEIVEGVRQAGGPQLGQLRLLDRDGGERPVDHSLAPIRDPQGAESGAVIVMRDATERLRHEAEIRASGERERERSRRLQQLSAATPALNSAPSVQALLPVIEQEARRLLDAPGASVRLGAAVTDFTDGLAIALDGRDGPGGVLHVAPRPERPYGEDERVLLGQLAGIATIALRNAQLYAELRENDRRKDDFLATLAHELRNPLAPLRTSLEILRRTPDAGAARRWLDVAERQTRHMVRLLDDLLDVSRISRGTIVLQREPVTVAAVLDAAIETSRPAIDARGHRLRLDAVDPALTVLGDATRLAQVFSNLLNNAANYTDPGGEIRVRVAREGDRVDVTVQDNGIGIEAAMLPRVFEMFVQAERPADRSGGLGIGLMLVRSLVELHGGTVRARSEGRGHGSEFTVCLPLLVSGARGQGPDREERAASPARGLRILLVDDNRDAAESLAALLAGDGHAVELAHDGPQALEAAARSRPDVALLDIGLPGLDGYEVARRLRRGPEGERLRLIAITGWGQPEDRRRTRDAGFDAHLVKPVDYPALSLHLREFTLP